MARKKACRTCGKTHEANKKCPRCTRQYDTQQRDKETVAFYKSKAWRAVRSLVGERDKYVCQSCKESAGKSFNCDHIVPRSQGGSDEADNLQCLCHECHSRKTLSENR